MSFRCLPTSLCDPSTGEWPYRSAWKRAHCRQAVAEVDEGGGLAWSGRPGSQNWSATVVKVDQMWTNGPFEHLLEAPLPALRPFRPLWEGRLPGLGPYSGVALRRGLEMVHLQRVVRPVSAGRLPRPPTLHFAELSTPGPAPMAGITSRRASVQMPEASSELGQG